MRTRARRLPNRNSLECTRGNYPCVVCFSIKGAPGFGHNSAISSSPVSFRAECPVPLLLREAPGHAVEESLFDVSQTVAKQRSNAAISSKGPAAT